MLAKPSWKQKAKSIWTSEVTRKQEKKEVFGLSRSLLALTPEWDSQGRLSSVESSTLVGGSQGLWASQVSDKLGEDWALTPHTEPGQGAIMAALAAVGTLVSK